MASESTERTSVFNSQDPQSPLLSVNMTNITKLTSQNYLMWRRQVRALLEGHELHQFIDDPSLAPSQTILTDGVSTVNPLYAPWRRQDRLLYSALIGAISPSVQSIISTATTTREVWDNLTEAFGNPTRGHIRQLKYQLKTCTKGNKSITEYLRIMKAKSDDLALLGKPLDTEDFTEQILAGLSEDYKPEIDAINARDNPISYVELYERLLNREAMLLCSESSVTVPVVANATDTRQRQQQRNQTIPRYQPSAQFRPVNNNQGSQRISRPYLGKCQACGVQGHSARYCPEFRIVRGQTQQQQWQPQPSAPPSWQHTQIQTPWQPRAHATSLSDSSTWLIDSGASHHMTSDLNNLSMHNPYSGGDEVLLGDGSALPITHTGPRSTNGCSSSGRQT